MPNVSSPLGTTQPYIPAVAPSQIGRFAGLAMVFPDLTTLNAAVAQELANVAATTPLWPTGQMLLLAPEFYAGGFYRVWNGTHARTVFVRHGYWLELADDTRTLTTGWSNPEPTAGAEGDYYLEGYSGTLWYRDAEAWSTYDSIFPVPPPFQIPIPADNFGADVKLQGTQNVVVEALNGSATMVSAQPVVLRGPQINVEPIGEDPGVAVALIKTLGNFSVGAENELRLVGRCFVGGPLGGSGELSLLTGGTGAQSARLAGGRGPISGGISIGGNATLVAGGMTPGATGGFPGEAYVQAGTSQLTGARGGNVFLMPGANEAGGEKGRIVLALNTTNLANLQVSDAPGSATVTWSASNGPITMQVRRWLPVWEPNGSGDIIRYYIPMFGA